MKEKRSLPLIFVIGMPIIYIFANFMINSHLALKGNVVSFSVFLYPITYLISGIIIRKTNYKNALRMMGVTVISGALAYVIEWSLLDMLNPWGMICSFLSFLICQLIFIYVFDFLIKIKKDSFFPIWFLAFGVNAIDQAFFGLLLEGKYLSLSIVIRALYILLIAMVLAKKNNK